MSLWNDLFPWARLPKKSEKTASDAKYEIIIEKDLDYSTGWHWKVIDRETRQSIASGLEFTSAITNRGARKEILKVAKRSIDKRDHKPTSKKHRYYA